MIFSKSCIYGLRAAVFIALSQSSNSFVSIKQISDNLNISFHFLTKILQILTQKNLLVSFRGPKGGVKLSRPPDQITLKELVEAIDGPDIFESCVLGLPGCGDDAPCPLHEQWSTIRRSLNYAFENTTLEELAKNTQRFNLRLTDLNSNDYQS